jgi:hypothetical protein
MFISGSHTILFHDPWKPKVARIEIGSACLGNLWEEGTLASGYTHVMPRVMPHMLCHVLCLKVNTTVESNRECLGNAAACSKFEISEFVKYYKSTVYLCFYAWAPLLPPNSRGPHFYVVYECRHTRLWACRSCPGSNLTLPLITDQKGGPRCSSHSSPKPKDPTLPGR